MLEYDLSDKQNDKEIRHRLSSQLS